MELEVIFSLGLRIGLVLLGINMARVGMKKWPSKTQFFGWAFVRIDITVPQEYKVHTKISIRLYTPYPKYLNKQLYQQCY